MGREKGEGEDLGKLGEMGWVGWRKDGYGIREEYISTKGVILGFTRDLIINGIPGLSIVFIARCYDC